MNTTLQQWLDDVLAVLVLYKTPLQESLTFRSLNKAALRNGVRIHWFIYDNSPVAGYKPEDHDIIYRHDETNAGVSKAYNEGFSLAKKSGRKWVLLLDQDTQFSEDILEMYYQSQKLYPGAVCLVPQLLDRNGIISPFKFSLGNGIRIKSVMEGVHFYNDLFFINSGAMISNQAFELSGGYDEDLPLDFSDYAFIERLKKHFTSFVVIPATANQQHSSSAALFERDLRRFEVFKNAARLFQKKYHPNNWFIALRVLTRSIRLSMKHRTVEFLVKYFDRK